MRFLEPKPRLKARDVSSGSYAINITVSDVNNVLIDRLQGNIELYLRKNAEHVIIARNDADSAKFDFACAIRQNFS